MFIDFEGIDGSGKTTLSNIVAERLRRLGYRVTHAREGGELKSPIARRLRELTRDASLLDMSERTEFFLNVARDTQQLEEVIRPALARGELCISDRYLYSQLALSGGGRGLPFDELEQTARFAAQGTWPDLVILVDVDPELARLRKRVAKSTAEESADAGSRKGLCGAGLAARLRRAFLAMARRDPARWRVVENDDQPLWALADRICEAIRARLGGRQPRTNPSGVIEPKWPAATLDNLESAFYAAVDELDGREPNLSLYLLTGLPGLAAHQRRLRHLEHAPKLVARTLAGLDDPESWELRTVLSALVPKDVLSSLGSDPTERAMSLREELFDRAPREAVTGLKRNDSPAAWSLRQRALSCGELEAVLLGLVGIDNELAWELRALGARKALVPAAARSLGGLAGGRADALRRQMWPQDRLAVLRSLTGIDTPYAAAVRSELFAKATKVVLRSLTGIDSAAAWRMRVAAAEQTKEALDSVDGMDAPEAWALRERFAPLWPSTALSSLRHLAPTARGLALIERVLRDHPGRLSVLRNAWITLARAQRKPQALEPRGQPAAPVDRAAEAL